VPETLLQLCTRVCETIGIDAPTSIAGNTNARAKSLLAMANKEIRSLKAGRFWPALTRFGTLNTVIGVDNYALPAERG
jgi:predicted RNase H-like nuclease